MSIYLPIFESIAKYGFIYSIIFSVNNILLVSFYVDDDDKIIFSIIIYF